MHVGISKTVKGNGLKLYTLIWEHNRSHLGGHYPRPITLNMDFDSIMALLNLVIYTLSFMIIQASVLLLRIVQHAVLPTALVNLYIRMLLWKIHVVKNVNILFMHGKDNIFIQYLKHTFLCSPTVTSFFVETESLYDFTSSLWNAMCIVIVITNT
jgi:hypothetical protein